MIPNQSREEEAQQRISAVTTHMLAIGDLRIIDQNENQEDLLEPTAKGVTRRTTERLQDALAIADYESRDFNNPEQRQLLLYVRQLYQALMSDKILTAYTPSEPIELAKIPEKLTTKETIRRVIHQLQATLAKTDQELRNFSKLEQSQLLPGVRRLVQILTSAETD